MCQTATKTTKLVLVIACICSFTGAASGVETTISYHDMSFTFEGVEQSGTFVDGPDKARLEGRASGSGGAARANAAQI